MVIFDPFRNITILTVFNGCPIGHWDSYFDRFWTALLEHNVWAMFLIIVGYMSKAHCGMYATSQCPQKPEKASKNRGFPKGFGGAPLGAFFVIFPLKIWGLKTPFTMPLNDW